MWYPSLMSQHLLPHLQPWSLLSSTCHASLSNLLLPASSPFPFQPLTSLWFFQPTVSVTFPFNLKCHFLTVLASPYPQYWSCHFSELSENKIYLVHFLFSLHLTPLQDVPSPETVPAPSRDLFLVKSHGHCSFLTLFHLSDLSNTDHIFIALFASGDSALPNTLSGVFWSLPFSCSLWKTHQKDLWRHFIDLILIPGLPYPNPHANVTPRCLLRILDKIKNVFLSRLPPLPISTTRS